MVAAPLPDDMLLERADVAGYARVLSRNGSRAEIRFSRLLKGRPVHTGLLGRLPFNRRATVAIRSQPLQPVPGDWWDDGAFLPGNRILTHLGWDARLGCYESIWWNASSIVPDGWLQGWRHRR